jgi:site-specific DNA-methyltransferase (adenine-specific)
MTEPYYADDQVTLYHGDYREHLFSVELPDAIITDPPYGETALTWDRWPDSWPTDAAAVTNALWCFGSFRMFLDQRDQFADWKFSHEIIWQKHAGTGFTTDKFRRVHEMAALWYQGEWGNLRHEVPRLPSTRPHRTPRVSARGSRAEHAREIGDHRWEDDGTRMQTTVIEVRNEHRRAVHPTQKPLGILAPLIEYSVPRGGLVMDLFSGSGAVALAARNAGRRCIAFEAQESYCEAAANRLAQQGFDFGDWDGESA